VVRAGVVPAANERAVDIDVVEDSEAEEVGGDLLAVIEHDLDALYGADYRLRVDSACCCVEAKQWQRPTPAKSDPADPGARLDRRRRVATDEVEGTRGLDIEPRRACAAVRTHRSGRAGGLAHVVAELGQG